ncbi:AraC family transcriptional regulator [Clostridium manihotivorum]|uniref:HTH araC/xylS-type domain-containing protein n=1 Tax=Clostridium manihotivorum TaxID=2320868 RepID=A0A410DVM7_9CLOT|nr:AraC family transcriptional regulator [Clostridium manihotivorum]QAA33186.1 hypothetical protein C1I91_16930 [Clostridium manihotivorum]
METEKGTLRETVDRGEALIPFYAYNHVWSNFTLYLHWHNEVEIIYVEKGSLVYTIDTIPIKVSEGEFIIINSGQLHSAHTICNGDCVHHALLFDLNFLNSKHDDSCQLNYLNPLLSGYYRFPTSIDINTNCGKKVIGEIKEILESYNEKYFGWEIAIKASLYKIFSVVAREGDFLINESTYTSAISYKITILKRVLNYIQKNYADKIYTEDLAKEVSMNPQYFCRFFKANTGKTPVDFINQYRIEQATKLIKNADKKISDICYEVGFENFSYFIKKFKEYEKCTPNQYRKSFN